MFLSSWDFLATASSTSNLLLSELIKTTLLISLINTMGRIITLIPNSKSVAFYAPVWFTPLWAVSIMHKFGISQVLPDKYLVGLTTEPYHVGTVYKKHTHKVVKILAQFPFPDFLKRVKPDNEADTNRILLCQTHNTQTIKSIRDALGELILALSVVEAPKLPCPLREKFSLWEHCWPCIYKGDHTIVTHSEGEVEYIKSLYQDKGSTIHLFSKQLDVLFKSSGQCLEGTILHGVILLLERWPFTQQFKKEAKIDPSLCELQNLQLATNDKFYYLTGLRMVVRGKLCQMCAMALIHSRLDRLYIDTEQVSPIKSICYNTSLNHNYDLFLLSD